MVEAGSGGWRAGTADALGCDRAIEALVGILQAHLVGQLVAVRVEFTHFPRGLQGIRTRSWGSWPVIHLALGSLHHLAALLLGHEGCGGPEGVGIKWL